MDRHAYRENTWPSPRKREKPGKDPSLTVLRRNSPASRNIILDSWIYFESSQQDFAVNTECKSKDMLKAERNDTIKKGN